MGNRGKVTLYLDDDRLTRLSEKMDLPKSRVIEYALDVLDPTGSVVNDADKYLNGRIISIQRHTHSSNPEVRREAERSMEALYRARMELKKLI